MSEIFQLFECGDVFQFTDPADSYQTWQGLRGPKGDPGEPGPPGEGLVISGIVDTVGELPASADQGEIYLVGEEAPYTAYVWNEGAWVSIGQITVGPQGPPGEDGQDGAAAGFGAPTISVGSGSGTPSATVTASGPDTAKVFAFSFDGLKGAQGDPGTPGQDGADGQDGVSPEVTIGTITGGHSVTITDAEHPTGQTFDVLDGEDGAPGAPGVGVPAGGSAGQVLTKTSGTDYDTGWATPEAGGGALYKQNVAILATSGTIATVSDANITADFVVASIVFANPSAITSNVTWTTGAGSLTLTGTCTSATTADIILVKT